MLVLKLVQWDGKVVAVDEPMFLIEASDLTGVTGCKICFSVTTSSA